MKNALIAAALAGAAIFPASAQDDPIETCRKESPNDATRILCLENAIRVLTTGAEAQTAAVEEEEERAPAAEAQTLEQATGLGAEQVNRRQAAKNKGEAEKNEPEALTAAVTEFAYTSLGDVILFLDNGQIWRQKSSDKNKLRLSGKRDYTVEVSEGMLSGYRLTVKELKRTILVERIK